MGVMKPYELTPSPELYGRILDDITRQKALLQLKKRLVWSLLGLLASLLVLTFAYQDFLAEITRSGFLPFFSLAASDFRIVSSDFKDYFLSLAEALPAISSGLLALSASAVIYLTYKLLRYTFQIKKLSLK